ncbi:MAG TPA: hypothetical protein DIC36_04275 [Gammaproteobacteria bacterium]|nr:hypothetical protein [Gammaproteobacteria bacterium]
MNWLADKQVNVVSLGALFALLIVFFSPNFGLKYGISPTLPSILLAFMGIWLVLRERAAVLASTAQRRWLLIFALLFVPMVISIPTSYDVRLSSGIAGASVLYAFAGVALIRALKGEGARHWLATGILIVLAFWCIDSVIQYSLGQDPFGITLTPDQRVVGPFDGNFRQATLLAVLLPTAMGALWYRRHGRLYAMIFFALAGMVAMLAGVRMVMLMLIIVMAGFFLHLPASRWKWLILPVLPIIAVLAVNLSPALQQRMSTVTSAEHLNIETLDKVLSYRATIWETGARMIRLKPLNGVGVGAFDKAYRDFSTRPKDVFRDGTVRVYHAHQIYVSAGAEMGLPGLLSLLAVFGLGIYWYLSASPLSRKRAWPWALALMVYFFPLNTQPPMFRHWTFPILLLLLAAMLSALDDLSADERASGPV